jgi:thiol-disulfide isomerase/thioredoxin
MGKIRWIATGLAAVLLVTAVGIEVAPRLAPGTASLPAVEATAVVAAAVTPAKADQVEPGLFQRLNPTPDLAGIVVSDDKGADVDLGRYKGKALLVNVWATWCAPCVAEMPSLNRLQAKLGSDQFAVVTVAMDEPNIDTVKDFMVKYQLDQLPLLVDANRAIDRQVRVPSLPASLLVSPDGKILARFIGGSQWDCGKPLAAVQNFIASGIIAETILDSCEN